MERLRQLFEELNTGPDGATAQLEAAWLALAETLRGAAPREWLEAEAWADTQPPARSERALRVLLNAVTDRAAEDRSEDEALWSERAVQALRRRLVRGGDRRAQERAPAPGGARETQCVVCGTGTGSSVSAYCSAECANSDH